MIGRNNVEQNCFSVCVKKHVLLEHGIESVILCNVENVDASVSKSEFVFEPNKVFLNSKNLCGAFELVKLMPNETIYVRVLNLNSNDVKLFSGSKLGTIEVMNVTNLRYIKDCEENLDMKELIEMHTDDKNLQNDDKLSIRKILTEYQDIFSRHKMDLGLCSKIEHKIETNGQGPIIIPPRRTPIATEEKVEEHIQDLLKNNIIQESDSPWNAPLVVIQKPNGKIRMCIDYRKLNQITDRPIFAIPDSRYLFDQLDGCCYFSSLDLIQGYYQVPMRKTDIEKTAFTTRSGHYEFLRLPFGLNGAPATFQKMMSQILSGLNWRICLIYLDDVLIFSKNREEHENRLKQVFNAIRKSGIKLSAEKCCFFKKELKYLGHVISKDGIKTDPNKIKAIASMPLPTYEHQLVSFLGFCGYYRKFILHFSDIVAPLEKICRKNTKHKPIVWNEDAKKSFESLKSALISSPVLSYPNKDGLFVLDTDASNSATGAVFSQIQNNTEKVIH